MSAEWLGWLKWAMLVASLMMSIAAIVDARRARRIRTQWMRQWGQHSSPKAPSRKGCSACLGIYPCEVCEQRDAATSKEPDGPW